MRRHAFLFVVMSVLVTSAGLAFQAGTDGPYKVLKTAKVGGEGGTDYIFADTVGRRLYITRNAAQAQAATDTRPEVPAFEKRLTIFDLDTLEPVGTITGCRRQRRDGVPEHGPRLHQRPSPALDVRRQDHEVDQDDRRAGGFSADGIYCDTSSDRVYIGSHPTKSLMVVDAKDGTVLGNVDLGGTPEQTVGDGKGTIYQVLQERPGGVAVVDAKTMKVTATYPFGENGGCNGLALDVKNQILFAACSAMVPPRARSPPPTPPQQTFVILSAKDGKILEQAAARRRLRRRGVQPGRRWKRSARRATAR